MDRATLPAPGRDLRACPGYRPEYRTTTPDLWPVGAGPAIEYSSDIDDWLIAITTGRYVGVTPESTVTQYPRPGIVYRPLRDAPPVPVRLVWWRDDPHPATAAVVGLLTALFRGS